MKKPSADTAKRNQAESRRGNRGRDRYRLRRLIRGHQQVCADGNGQKASRLDDTTTTRQLATRKLA